MSTQIKIMTADDRYHIRLSRESNTIRFYLWVYQMADIAKINTCKLFWAYVFVPVVLPLMLLARVVVPIIDAAVEWHDTHQMNRPPKLDIPEESKEPKGPGRAERFIDAVSGFMGRVWFKWQRGITYAYLAIAWLLAIAMVGALVYLSITYPMNILAALGVAMGVITAAFGVLGIIGGVHWLLTERTKGARKTKEGFDSFRSAMGKSAHAFHNHTCAVVDVEETINA